MSLVKLENKIEMGGEYKDFDFIVGSRKSLSVDGLQDYVRIWPKVEVVPAFLKGAGGTAYFIDNTKIELYIAQRNGFLTAGPDSPRDNTISIIPFIKKLNEMERDLKDSEGLVDAINKTIQKMREDSKYPWKQEQK